MREKEAAGVTELHSSKLLRILFLCKIMFNSTFFIIAD